MKTTKLFAAAAVFIAVLLVVWTRAASPTTLAGGMTIFNPTWTNSGTPAIATGSWFMDAAGAKIWIVFQAPKTGSLKGVQIRTGAVISAQDLKFEFEDVDLTTGFPDGVVDQYRVVASASVTANTWITPGIMSSDGTDGGTLRSVTAGDYVAFQVEWSGSTGNVDYYYWSGLSFAGGPRHSNYMGKNTAKNTSFLPLFALQYSDDTYGQIDGGNLPPAKLINTTSFASNSTPDERGMYFVPDVTMAISGVWIQCNLSQANADIVLYDTDGTTALMTRSLDKDVALENAANPLFVPFAPVTVTAGSAYRIVVKPSTTTSITTYDFDVESNARLAAVQGGVNWYYTSRTDAGAWTQTTTKRPWMGLYVTSFTPSGSGETSFVFGGRPRP